MNSIEQSITRVKQRIRAAEIAAQRPAHSVKLLAVSKTRPADALRAAYLCGQHSFAENYLQEAESKIAGLSDLDLEWHFIGSIQSNKTRTIAELFDWVHTVDRIKIAKRLSEQRSVDRLPLNICLQVNISGEASKSGVPPAELGELAEAIQHLPGLRLRGLMALPAPSTELHQQRKAFDALSCLQQELINMGIKLDTLSMGTTDDMEAAILSGATMVRIGTALFGPRIRQ